MKAVNFVPKLCLGTKDNLEGTFMKAVVYTKYGSPDVLQIRDIEKPAPGDNEVLIKIHAASVNAYDWHFLTADIFLIRFMGGGLFKPKYTRLGADIAGRIEAVGKNVKQFQPGDEVYGMVRGGFAEYTCAVEDRLALKPVNLSFEQAAAVPMAGITALQGLRDEGKIQAGQKVLINGASGGIGSMAVQLAKHFGAEVTGVCGTPRLEFVKSLGADKVIDYTKEDFTQNGETYDLIFDILGRSSFSKLKRSLKPDGIYLLASYKMKALFQLLWTSLTDSKQKVICAFANETAESLVFVKGLVEEGKIKAIVDKSFPMEQAAEAHRYVEEGRKQGSVVITISG